MRISIKDAGVDRARKATWDTGGTGRQRNRETNIMDNGLKSLHSGPEYSLNLRRGHIFELAKTHVE